MLQRRTRLSIYTMEMSTLILDSVEKLFIWECKVVEFSLQIYRGVLLHKFWSRCNCSAISLGSYFGLSQFFFQNTFDTYFKSFVTFRYSCKYAVFNRDCWSGGNTILVAGSKIFPKVLKTFFRQRLVSTHWTTFWRSGSDKSASWKNCIIWIWFEETKILKNYFTFPTSCRGRKSIINWKTSSGIRPKSPQFDGVRVGARVIRTFFGFRRRFLFILSMKVSGPYSWKFRRNKSAEMEVEIDSSLFLFRYQCDQRLRLVNLRFVLKIVAKN